MLDTLPYSIDSLDNLVQRPVLQPVQPLPQLLKPTIWKFGAGDAQSFEV